MDVDPSQIPVENYFPENEVPTQEVRKLFRYTRHLLKLCGYRIGDGDPLLKSVLNEYRSELEVSGDSFDEIVSQLGIELNNMLSVRGSKGVTTSTRSDAWVRRKVLERKRYWKIPPPVLEKILKDHPGRDTARVNEERYQAVTADIERMCR